MEGDVARDSCLPNTQLITVSPKLTSHMPSQNPFEAQSERSTAQRTAEHEPQVRIHATTFDSPLERSADA